MSTNENQYFIHLRSTKERIPCTKEEFELYYRDINAFRKRQQRHGKCVCPQIKRLECDMDCFTCPFHRAGDSLSLDYTTTFENGEEIRCIDSISDPSPLIEELVIDSLQIAELFEKLIQIMPQAIIIGKLRQKGMNDTDIAELIGIPRKTFTDRLERAKAVLKKEFPELF